jgi:3-hydroxyisobutyrate dehydrogenase-like beta-hydroxyacid dehydrogenase
MTVVGIVSPGAMGSAVGRALRDGGARAVATVVGRSPRTAALAHGLELLPSLDDVVATAEVLLSIVPPGEAAAVAASVAAAAGRTGATPLVADLNATAPATARAIAADLARAGLELVDGSISGGPPLPAGATIVYLSGRRAAEVAALPAPGVEMYVVGDEIGLASAVKMSTASIYKGRLALLVQALRAAHANGVLEHVLADLRRSDPVLVDRASPAVQRGASVAGRYDGEMREIAAAQAEAGLTPALFEAFADVYAEMSRSPLGALEPEQVDATAALEDMLDRL